MKYTPKERLQIIQDRSLEVKKMVRHIFFPEKQGTITGLSKEYHLILDDDDILLEPEMWILAP